MKKAARLEFLNRNVVQIAVAVLLAVHQEIAAARVRTTMILAFGFTSR